MNIARRSFTWKVEKIQFHQKLHPSPFSSFFPFIHIDEKKRLWKILRNHVWKLISGYERRQSFPLRHDNWFREGNFLHPSFFTLFSELNSPMSDVEKTKRSEYSLHPYRFLLNREMASINQLIMSWANRTKKNWWIFIIFVAVKGAMKYSFVNDVKWAFTVVGYWWKDDLSQKYFNQIIWTEKLDGLLMRRFIKLSKVFNHVCS